MKFPRLSSVRSRVAASVVAGSLAVGTIGAYEGMTNKAVIPIPGDVPTICFGETKDVRMGDTRTTAECKAMFRERLNEFARKMEACLPNHAQLADQSYVAFLSLSYNIGSDGFCRSSIATKIRAGDIEGACNRILVFDRAGGRVVKGLQNRRQSERTLCLEGLK